MKLQGQLATRTISCSATPLNQEPQAKEPTHFRPKSGDCPLLAFSEANRCPFLQLRHTQDLLSDELGPASLLSTTLEWQGTSRRRM